MGLFNNFFGGAVELNKLANAAANVMHFLDLFETDDDPTYLLTSAWMCKVGITDRVERNNWKPNFIVYVQRHGHLTKMTIMEVYVHTIGRLKNKAEIYWDSSMAKIVDNILAGEEEFYNIDRQIPQNLRDVVL